MDLIITSERGAETIMRQEDHQVARIVSIVDPGNKWELKSGDVPKLVLRFHDEEDPPRKGTQPVQLEQVAEAFRFLSEANKSDRVLIHCWAGARRSAAFGFVYASFWFGITQLAVSAVNHGAVMQMDRQHRFIEPSRVNPNRRIVRIADELLGYRGAMIDLCERAWPRHPG